VKNVWKVWSLALAIKIVIAIWLPFANDEAYYWVWGHHLQLSYFDHPGMVAWLFYLGTFIENIGNAARLPGVLLGHGTLAIWVLIAKPYVDERKLAALVIFLALSPFLGLGSLILTPDIPLLFFWSASLLIFRNALETKSTRDYALLGATLGLGFCSKYLIVLFVPCALVYLVLSKTWREVRVSKVFLTIAIGLLFCAPVIVWNQQHDWASFKFQISHGLESEKRNALWPLEYFGSQLGILFPVAVYFAMKRRGPLLLKVFGWLPLAFFFYTSFRAHVEANWPAMGHPALLALAFINAPDSKALRAQTALWIVAAIAIFAQVIHPWIPVDPRKLKTYEFTHYDDFIPIAQTRPDLFMGSYQEAAALSYKMRRQIYKLHEMNRRDFYDFTSLSRPTGDSFVIGAERWQGPPTWILQDGFEIVTETRVNDEFKLIEMKKRTP
jgi:4-amino-4-deoxy-L-arabinose transferase-like glycosyltransferase